MNHRMAAALCAAWFLSGSLPAAAGVIDGGEHHTCAVDREGRAWCWGSDALGQQGDGLADGTTASPHLVGSFSEIAAGGSHACGLTAAGSVWCWGRNVSNQIGDGTSMDRTEPTSLAGLEATSISAGSLATCAVRSSGKVACWGESMISAPGAPDNAKLPSDITIPSLISFTRVSVGLQHACALNAAGQAWCWGHNPYGQLGIGSKGETSVAPASVLQPAGIAFESIVAGGSHTCAVDASGDAWCWGGGLVGQLGIGQVDSPIPAKVMFPEPVHVTQFALGAAFTCALDTQRRIWCWGANNAGQAALNSARAAPVVQPELVEFPAGLRFESLGAGDNSACAIATLGETWCWGDGTQGQLGLGYFGRSSSPIPIADSTGFSGLTSGGMHSCMIDPEGHVWCWGSSAFGQLGRGDTTDSASAFPIDMSALPAEAKFAQISAGGVHTCGVLQTGEGYCWGVGLTGRLGSGVDYGQVPVAVPAPVVVALPEGVQLVQVSAGGGHTCAIDTQKQLWCWGDNRSDQLGDGSGEPMQLAPVPVVVPGKSFRSVAAGERHTCAVEDVVGSIYCWGENQSGQLGFGDTMDRSLPTPWPGLTNFGFSHVVSGSRHTCALRAVPGDNTLSALHCWGENGHGQLGDGTTMDRPTPVASGFVVGSGDAVRAAHLALGDNHTCARRPGGNTECWGNNSEGQLADGSFANKLTASPSNFANAFELAAGSVHTCALDGAGQLACSGHRGYGQLGDGKMAYVAPPQAIPGFVAFTTFLFEDGFE